MYLSAIAMTFDPYFLLQSSQKKVFSKELSVPKEKFGISYGLDEANKVVLTDILPGSSAWLSNELVTGNLAIGIQFGSEALLG
jgi:carboxyl-terminal processing protease